MIDFDLVHRSIFDFPSNKYGSFPAVKQATRKRLSGTPLRTGAIEAFRPLYPGLENGGKAGRIVSIERAMRIHPLYPWQLLQGTTNKTAESGPKLQNAQNSRKKGETRHC